MSPILPQQNDFALSFHKMISRLPDRFQRICQKDVSDEDATDANGRRSDARTCALTHYDKVDKVERTYLKEEQSSKYD